MRWSIPVFWEPDRVRDQRDKYATIVRSKTALTFLNHLKRLSLSSQRENRTFHCTKTTSANEANEVLKWWPSDWSSSSLTKSMPASARTFTYWAGTSGVWP